jgi:hypothetical protein
VGTNVVSFAGNIVASPGAASDCAFPAAVTQIAFGSGGNILANASSLNSKSVNSAAAFVPLDGVGVGETVTTGTFLYVRTNQEMTLRLTTQGAPDLVAEIPIWGTMIFQFPQSKYLKLLEVKGVGTLEYLVAGMA